MKGCEFANFTVPALKAFLKGHSQSVSGNKHELAIHALGCRSMHFFPMHSGFSGQAGSETKTLFPHLP